MGVTGWSMLHMCGETSARENGEYIVSCCRPCYHHQLIGRKNSDGARQVTALPDRAKEG